MPSLIQRQRALLRKLSTEVAGRASAERLLDERQQKVSQRATRELEDARAAAEAEFRKAATALESEYKKETQAAQSSIEGALTAARTRMERQVGLYNGRTSALNKAAQTEFDESKWLAETLVESGDVKIRAEFEVNRKGIEKALAEIKQQRVQADDLLTSKRHPPLPPLEEAQPSSDPAEPLPALAEQLRASRDALAKRLAALDRTISPPPLRLGPGFALVLLIGAGAGYAGYRLKQTPESVFSWAAGGVVGTLLLVLILRLISRRRVPAAATALAQAFDAALLSAALCMRRAQADRDRQSVELLARRDEELKKAERKLAAARREITRRVNVGTPRLRDRHARRLADIRARGESRLGELRAANSGKLRAAEKTRDAALASAKAVHAKAMEELNELDRSERGIVESHWKRSMAEVQAEAADIIERMTGLCPEWSQQTIDGYEPTSAIPPAVCFGQIEADAATLPGGLSSHPSLRVDGPTKFSMPAMLDLYDRGSLFIRTGKGQGDRERAVGLLNDIMLRLLAAFPPGKVRFTIIDPVGLGQSFAGFMHLADHDEQLVGGRIWTDPKHIEQRLTDLTEHMETVIQKYLRNEYETIQQYNEHAGEVAEPYRFLVIADFPANLTEAAAKRLASIAQSGARCGLYTLIATAPADARAKPPAWVPMAALEESSQVLSVTDGAWASADEELSKWPLTVERPPSEEQLNSLLHRIGAAAKDASRVQVSFDFVSPKPEQIWSLDSARDVHIALGRAGAKALQYMTLGRGTAQHALIAGRTGSGKSTLLHVLITNLALWYSPDQIEMYLVDFKKGVEFKTYATHALPHARVVAVESEREFGLSVLRKLDAELTRRGQLFREAGSQDVAAFRAHLNGSGAMPRVLLIVDEFQEFFVEDDKLAQEASLLLDRLVRQGRAFGMHVVLGSQTLGGAYSIARSTIGQMAVRIALQCSEADSYLIMSEDNAAPRLLSRPGEAIYNDVSGRIEGNSLFQIVWLPDATRERALQAVHTRARPGTPPPIVFEGNIPGDLARNHLLTAAIKAPPGGAPRAFLGDPISIKDPTSVSFRRQSGGNLLIVGQQDDAAAAMLTAAIVSLLAHGPASIRIIDSTPADSPHAAELESLAAGVPGLVRFYRPRDVAAAVGEIAAELAGREQAGRQDAPPIFLVLVGLQRLRDLRKEDEFSFSSSTDGPKSPAQLFSHMLREGPPLGVHTIVTCDTATNVDRALDRNALREFDSRVLFQMSSSDSTHLIDSPTASTLGRNRALVHSEETGVVEKFRPYAPVDPAFLSAALAAVAARSPTA